MRYLLFHMEKPSDAFLDAFEGNIRPNDRKELLAVNTTVKKELSESITGSEECYAVTTDTKEPLALFGRKKIEDYPGNLIWCVGTNRLREFWFPFIRESRKVLREWAHKHGVLYNAVGSFNTEAMRWLSWLGADFTSTVEIGGEDFFCFELREENI